MTYVLDTGVWYRALVAPTSVPPHVQEILQEANVRFGLSSISLWEIAKKVQIGKLQINQPLAQWLHAAVTAQIELLPLTAKLVAEAMVLPGFPNRDPADELIVATARIHNLTLMTTDRDLRNYRHARVLYFKPLSET